MFIAAIARQRWDYSRNKWFDGKLGVWPFVEYLPAKRSSKNRSAGMLVPNPVNVDKSTYKKVLIENVFAIIRSKWPGSEKVVIQHDNARPHSIDD